MFKRRFFASQHVFKDWLKCCRTFSDESFPKHEFPHLKDDELKRKSRARNRSFPVLDVGGRGEDIAYPWVFIVGLIRILSKQDMELGEHSKKWLPMLSETWRIPLSKAVDSVVKSKPHSVAGHQCPPPYHEFKRLIRLTSPCAIPTTFKQCLGVSTIFPCAAWVLPWLLITAQWKAYHKV